MVLRYAQPDNEDDFEQFCLRFYRKHWSNESLSLYGKRGEKQFGVDIHDPLGAKPIRAVQCKHRESTKSLTPKEILAEVTKVEEWHQPLERYVIATTARKSRSSQDEIARLNARPTGQRKFIVEIHFWEDFCEFLSGYNGVLAYAIVHGSDVAGALISSILKEPEVAAQAREALKFSIPKEKDPEFCDIEALLTARNLDAARYAIEKLPVGEAMECLSAESRYKIIRLRANLALEERDFDLASRLLLEAFAIQPNLAQAKQCRVLGYLLKRDNNQAFTLAEQYVREGVVTPEMLLRLVESVPTREQLDRVLPLLEPHLEQDDDINVALTHRLISFGDASAARVTGERAIRIAEKSPHAHFAAGSAAHYEATRGGSSKRRGDLDYALAQYTAAVELATELKYLGLLPEILSNRGAVHGLLENREAAKADYKASVTKADKPSLYAPNAVSYFFSITDSSGVDELLPYLDGGTEEGQFFSTLIRFELAENDDDRCECFRKLAELAKKSWSRSVECRMHCVKIAVSIGNWDLARSVITEAFKKAHPFQANAALGWIAAKSKVGDPAEFARAAVAAGMANTQPTERRVLADLLAEIGDLATALTLLEQNVIPGVFNDDARRLIECAQKTERHDLLLRICREQREVGAQAVELRQLEMLLLNRYAPEQGLALVDRFIDAGDMREYFVAFKNVLAVRLGRRELLNFRTEDLPTPRYLKPSQAMLVIYPYVENNKIDEAIEFLYAQLRLNFDDAQSHKNYISFIAQYGNKGAYHAALTRVAGECAVWLDLGNGRSRCVVIENNAPVASRGECSSDTEMAKAIKGKLVGDSIAIPGGIGLAERATIREIQSKYVCAFRDCLDKFRSRFPDEYFVQAIHTGSGDSLDLTGVIELIKKEKQFAEECVQFYLHNHCTLYLLAERLGVSEREVMLGLSQYTSGYVKCSHLAADERIVLTEHGIPKGRIVLSVSGITTLGLLDGWEFLDKTKQYFVSQATWELVSSWVSKAEGFVERETVHTSVSDGGELQIHAPARMERESQLDKLRALKERIGSLCEISSAQSVAAVEPKKRAIYEDVVGFHNIEGICLANDLDAMFWSDDAALSLLAKVDFQVASAWTQLALLSNAKKGLVSKVDYDQATAKLIGMRYENLAWTASTVIRAGELAEWEPSGWPFKQCLELVPNISPRERVRLLLDVMQLLRSSTCGVIRSSGVVQALLSAIKDRQLILRIYSRLPEFFHADIDSANFFAPEFEYWLSCHLA